MKHPMLILLVSNFYEKQNLQYNWLKIYYILVKKYKCQPENNLIYKTCLYIVI